MVGDTRAGRHLNDQHHPKGVREKSGCALQNESTMRCRTAADGTEVSQAGLCTGIGARVLMGERNVSIGLTALAGAGG